MPVRSGHPATSPYLLLAVGVGALLRRPEAGAAAEGTALASGAGVVGVALLLLLLALRPPKRACRHELWLSLNTKHTRTHTEVSITWAVDDRLFGKPS